MTKILLSLLSLLLLCACAVGPDYIKPCVLISKEFKEAPKGWKIAEPKDSCDRGPWWTVFNDAELNALIKKLDVSNQNIALAIAQYQQALALINQARAAYFPTVTGQVSDTRQQLSSSGKSSFLNPALGGSVTGNNTPGISGSGSGGGGGSNNGPFTQYLFSLSATWEPDVWGAVYRAVQASEAGAESAVAQVASVRLAMQGSLAQFYYQLRANDATQQLLADTVLNYKKTLGLTKNRYRAGTASRLDVIQAETQLENAQVQATDNKINRALYEHAIAALIGLPPACFSIAPVVTPLKPPKIPITVPSVWLERRPDVAASERLAAQASAQIGVAISAYFPTLTLSGTGGYQSNSFSQWFVPAAQFWSLGAQLAETLYEGGLRAAQVNAARAVYDQNVATYRQTVLTAFQEVEDNLASIRILNQETKTQQAAVNSAAQALNFVLNQYKAGTAQYSDVVIAQITLFTAQKALVTLQGRQMVSAVGLVKALGGGWDRGDISPCKIQQEREALP